MWRPRESHRLGAVSGELIGHVGGLWHSGETLCAPGTAHLAVWFCVCAVSEPKWRPASRSYLATAVKRRRSPGHQGGR